MISYYPNSFLQSLWCVAHSIWISQKVEGVTACAIANPSNTVYVCAAHFGEEKVTRIKTCRRLIVILCTPPLKKSVLHSMSTISGKKKTLQSYLIVITHKIECGFIWSLALGQPFSVTYFKMSIIY